MIHSLLVDPKIARVPAAEEVVEYQYLIQAEEDEAVATDHHSRIWAAAEVVAHRLYYCCGLAVVVVMLRKHLERVVTLVVTNDTMAENRGTVVVSVL